MMEKSLIVERKTLPPHLLEWLEAGNQMDGIIRFREEDGKIVLERLENVDPEMMARVRANIEKYHSVLERLADS